MKEIIESLKPFTSEALKWEILWKSNLDPNYRLRLKEEIEKTKAFYDANKTDWVKEAQQP